MPKQPIILRDAASDAQARKNAANSMQLRNLADINEDFPGIENVPLITSPLAAAVSSTITGKGIVGGVITPYYAATAVATPVAQATVTVGALGTWTFAASTTAGRYFFTQTITGRPISSRSDLVITT